jgi:hypothetical protein
MPPKRARSASVKKTADQVAGAAEDLVKGHGYEFGGPYDTVIEQFGAHC